MGDARTSRAAAPVVGNVLLVAVVVVVAATVSVLALGYAEETTRPGPVVAESSGSLEPNDGGSDTGIVTLRHVAGDPVRTSEMVVRVDATDACGKRGRLVDLPVDGAGGNAIADSNIDGDDVFDERPPYLGGPRLSALHEPRYAAGEELRFRIPDTDCPIRAGDRVTVRVVHTPTNSLVTERTLVAE